MDVFAANFLNLTANSNATSADNVDHSFDQLLPTLVECFIIIFSGYIAGRFKFIAKENSKGMNYFTANLAMPAMIFLNLASLDFRDVNWTFFAAILTSKSIVFIFVIFLTSIVRRPVDLSVAAIYAVFVTHVNDFGLGYPIFNSLYAKQNPMYPGYIYLIGQISLVVLNPVAFVLMEVERVRKFNINAKTEARELFKIALKVAWKILSNPNVWMTALAIVVNICFYDKMPKILENVLNDFAAAFQALVLFLLGICVVGVGKTQSPQTLVIGLLLVMKILVTPLVTRAAVQLFCSWAPDKKTLSDYGFLYGTIPTAPVVLLYAVEFGLPTDMLAAALVLCTLISGPVMYISTRMIAVQIFTILQYMEQLKEILFYLSIISLLSNIWVGVLLIINGWLKRVPYSVVGCLLLSQVIMSVGVLMWSTSGTDASWTIYLQLVSTTGGLLAARFWTALLAITIMLRHRHTDLKLDFLNCYYLLFGFGIPAAIVSGLMLINGFLPQEPTVSYKVPSFLYGPSQAYASLVVMSFCLMTTLICLVMFSRDKQIDILQTLPVKVVNTLRRLSIIREESPSGSHQETSFNGIVVHDNNADRTRRSSKSCSNEIVQPKSDVAKPVKTEELKHFPHVILLLLQCVSMIVSIIVTIWRLMADDHSGIYIAIEFLDVVLTFGQGFYCLAVYGYNTIDIVAGPILKLWAKIKLRREQFRRPKNVDEKSLDVCKKFVLDHYHDCVNNLPQIETSKRNKTKNVFLENDLVQWLIKENVVKRDEASTYFKHLQTGNIVFIHKLDSDGRVFYCFNQEMKF